MRIWWVATDGDDSTGDGSQNNPLRTIEYALTVFTSGDQIRLKEGTYETTGTITVDGMEGSIFSDSPGGATLSPQSITEDDSCVSIKNSGRFYIYGVNVIYEDIASGKLIGIRAKNVYNFVCVTCSVTGLESASGNVYGIFGSGSGRIMDCDVSDIKTGGAYLKGIYAQGLKVINCSVQNLSGLVSDTRGIEEWSNSGSFEITSIVFVL